MSYKYLMQVAPRASSRGTSLANLDSLHPDQKNSSKVAGLGVDGGGGCAARLSGARGGEARRLLEGEHPEVTSYTRYKLQVTSFKLQVTSYKRDVFSRVSIRM